VAVGRGSSPRDARLRALGVAHAQAYVLTERSCAALAVSSLWREATTGAPSERRPSWLGSRGDHDPSFAALTQGSWHPTAFGRWMSEFGRRQPPCGEVVPCVLPVDVVNACDLPVGARSVARRRAKRGGDPPAPAARCILSEHRAHGALAATARDANGARTARERRSWSLPDAQSRASKERHPCTAPG
jgi:hypothetical protein